MRREPARRAAAGVLLAARAVAGDVEAGALELGVAERARVLRRVRRAGATDGRVRRRARLEELVVHADRVVLRIERDVEVAFVARPRLRREPRDERVVERRAHPLGPLARVEVEVEREALRVRGHLNLEHHVDDVIRDGAAGARDVVDRRVLRVARWRTARAGGRADVAFELAGAAVLRGSDAARQDAERAALSCVDARAELGVRAVLLRVRSRRAADALRVRRGGHAPRVALARADADRLRELRGRW